MNSEEKLERKRKWYSEWAARNPESVYKRNKAYNLRHPKRSAFSSHKAGAKFRGIEFLFSRDEWIDWWGDDFDKRGRAPTELCMARIGDKGSYNKDNVIKATNLDNQRRLV